MSVEIEELLKNCIGFNWDQGNSTKNWDRHSVSKLDSEQVFFNEPLVVFDSKGLNEKRFLALGRTNQNRLLAIVFTVRNNNLIRVISARDMSKKERKVYDKKK